MIRLLNMHTYFNPRSHEGSDVLTGKWGNGQANFNPRSHEGSDDIH